MASQTDEKTKRILRNIRKQRTNYSKRKTLIRCIKDTKRITTILSTFLKTQWKNLDKRDKLLAKTKQVFDQIDIVTDTLKLKDISLTKDEAERCASLMKELETMYADL